MEPMSFNSNKINSDADSHRMITNIHIFKQLREKLQQTIYFHFFRCSSDSVIHTELERVYGLIRKDKYSHRSVNSFCMMPNITHHTYYKRKKINRNKKQALLWP